MSAPRSAGIVLYRTIEGDLQVLLGHLGGPLFARKRAGAWTIPKGLIEDGEDVWTTARREFAEETGTLLEGPGLDLGLVRHRSGKWVHGFAVEGDLDADTAVSNEFTMEWPRGSGRTQSFPELDRFAWYALDEARPLVPKGQDQLFDRLSDLVGG